MAEYYQETDQQTLGTTAKQIATAPFKLSTYAGMYMYNPGMYSPTKGLYVPGVGKYFSGRSIGEGVGKIVSRGSAFIRKKGIVKGSLGIAVETVRRTGTFGIRGGAYVGEKFLQEGGLARSLYQDVYQQSLQNNLNRGLTKKGAKVAARDVSDKALLYATQGKKSIAKFGSKYAALKGVQDLGKKKLFGTIAKYSLGAAKLGSGFMGFLAIKDIIEMVGVPLGRAAIRTLDNALTQYNERFMPDTGGNLALSYLSKGAATERQRAIQAISKAYINGRSALGSEAKYV